MRKLEVEPLRSDSPETSNPLPFRVLRRNNQLTGSFSHLVDRLENRDFVHRKDYRGRIKRNVRSGTVWALPELLFAFVPAKGRFEEVL